jgi:hypothetical protein
MSWSVSASGTPSEVRGQLSEQFKGPLAAKPAGLSDDGERQSVRQVADLLEQISTTFDPEGRLNVSASGHMGFADWDKKTGGYQSVNLTITPLPDPTR